MSRGSHVSRGNGLIRPSHEGHGEGKAPFPLGGWSLSRSLPVVAQLEGRRRAPLRLPPPRAALFALILHVEPEDRARASPPLPPGKEEEEERTTPASGARSGSGADQAIAGCRPGLETWGGGSGEEGNGASQCSATK